MVVTVEMSMYPLQAHYVELIDNFIRKLNCYQNLRVNTGPTATVVIGEYVAVMAAITELLAWSHGEQGQSVFVCKFILGYNPE